MRLAEFILSNTETILAEWEAFAATLLPAARTDHELITVRAARANQQAVIQNM